MKIQVVGLTIVALMLGAAAAHAQGTPKAEMSLGYAYMHDNDLSDNFPKGFVASIGGYFSDWMIRHTGNRKWGRRVFGIGSRELHRAEYI